MKTAAGNDAGENSESESIKMVACKIEAMTLKKLKSIESGTA